MYTLTKNIKILPIVLMALGLIGMAIGFSSAPGSIEEVEQILASQHHGGHGEGHATKSHDTHDAHAKQGHGHEAHGTETHGKSHDTHGEDAHAAHEKHLHHVLHQLQNKPWAALYVAAFFFFMIALGVLVFYAIQFAAQAGWSPLLFRVMEAITAYLLPGGIIMFIILALSGFHMNHLFVWMDSEVVAHDELIQGKTGWLNVPFFLIRAALYLIAWNVYRHFAVKFSKKQDEEPNGNVWYKKSFKAAAVFLVVFIYTESMMSWDWIMSVDPHWFSTLFGWYVFASMFVSGITVIALITIYLKSKGYLPNVNNSHLHDLAKFMFGISIFWTYLWFSQFMLIWYSDIPEEVTYFVQRINDYTLPFFGMVALNLIFPLLVLMNSDFKRINWIIVLVGVVILVGHYIDIFNMIMPATVGGSWFIGLPEISAVLFFLGLFIFVVFKALTKEELEPSGNPYLGESKHFHY